MPAIAARGRGRRTINEINMVPFIDVMLVLLIIFMVTAPMLTPGMVDVPSVGKGKNLPKVVATVIVEQDGKLRFKTGDSTRTVSLKEIGPLAARWQKEQSAADSPVLISADKGVQYDMVVKAMDALHKAGVQRVGLAVKQGSS
ncbi:MAG: ExbD/TolR family protein [Burkholderiaceae bacterium]